MLIVSIYNIKEGSYHSDNPVPITFDTDLAGDVDDVGALASFRAIADYGEVEPGVMASATYPLLYYVLIYVRSPCRIS